MKRLIPLLFALLPLCGCLDETLELTLLPDGSGKIRLEQRLKGNMGGMIKTAHKLHESTLGFLDEGEEPPLSPGEEMLAEQMASFQGVDAWTDLTVEFSDEGDVVLRAEGVFRDVNAIYRDMDGSGYRFVHTTDEQGNHTLEARQAPGPEDLEDFEAVAEAMRMFRRAAKDATQTIVFQLPAAPTKTAGFGPTTADPRRVSLVYDIEAMDDYMERYVPVARKLWKQVQEGTTSRERALELLERAVNLPRTLASFPADAPSDPELAAQIKQAIAGWDGSKLKRTLERAKAKAEAEAVGLDPDMKPGPFPAGLVAAEVFELELQPNGAAKVNVTTRFALSELPEAFEKLTRESGKEARDHACLNWFSDSLEGIAFVSWELEWGEEELTLKASGYSGEEEAIVHTYEDEESFEDRRAFAIVSRWNDQTRKTELWIEAEGGEGAPPVEVRFTPPAAAQAVTGFTAGEGGALSYTLSAKPEAASLHWTAPDNVAAMDPEFNKLLFRSAMDYAQLQMKNAMKALDDLGR